MELPILASNRDHDPAALARAARTSDRAIAATLGEIISEDWGECVVDPTRPTVTHLNAVLQLNAATPLRPLQVLSDARDVFSEHGVTPRWVVPSTDSLPDAWQDALMDSGYEPATTSVLVMQKSPTPEAGRKEAGPAQCVPAQAVMPEYEIFLQKVIHINKLDDSERISAAMGLLDVHEIDILAWRIDGALVADAVIQTVADIGLIRTIRSPNRDWPPDLRDQIVDGVIRWCNRCQFRSVIAAMEESEAVPSCMVEPLGMEPVATYSTWHLRQ